MRTQVGILGAGPAGLLLGQMLAQAGIEAVVLERRDRAYVESRVRAGVLEQGTVDALTAVGVGGRLAREGLRHTGVHIRFDGATHRIDLAALTGGQAVTVYGQQEVVRDLIAARIEAGLPLLFSAEATAIDGIDTDRASVTFTHDGVATRLACDVVVACDGFHGIGRPALVPHGLTWEERVYPFAWLGILAEVAPVSDELIYAHHPDGFALLSMRSPTVTRLYLQCRPDEDISAWTDAAIWAALDARLVDRPMPRGPILARGITPMRSFVAAPMRAGRLFLAGDAAHIVPPTGAKGMNLAVADVRRLAPALVAWLRDGDARLADAYSDAALRRVWRVQRFSAATTAMLHAYPAADGFARRLQRAQLEELATSPHAMAAFATSYVGLPLDG